LNSFLCSL